ncbi:MAG: response regulator [Planctomycetota bacterium]
MKVRRVGATGDSGYSVLLVDDSDDDLEFLRLAIGESTESELSLSDASDGFDALSRMRDMCTCGERPDLAIVDLKMPRLDGRGFLRAVREDETFSTMPVLILSTSIADSDVAGCYADGCNAFLQKPLEYRELVDLMRDVSRHWLGHVYLPPR